MKMPKNKDDDPEPTDEGDIQMKYSSDYLYKPSIGGGKEKKYM
jgi:hypothetical protein